MIIWPCCLNSSGSNGLMLWEEVWLGIWSDLTLPIYICTMGKRNGSGFFGFLVEGL